MVRAAGTGRRRQARQRSKVAKPNLGRSYILTILGDAGQANFHRACGWLSAELLRGGILGPRSKVGIWNGDGAMGSIRAVADGEADAAFVTPANFAQTARDGRLPSGETPFPHLRAIGHVPQDDRLLVAVRREFGVRSFRDLRKLKPKLRITTGVEESFIGVAAHQLLEAHGLSRAEIESWGGRFVGRQGPLESVRDMADGNADAIVQEAIMTPEWHRMAEAIDLAFLPMESSATRRLDRRFGWPTGRLSKGYLRGMERDIAVLDYSDFLLITTTALPEELGHALAWCLVETWDRFEAQYHSVPRKHSTVTYPLDPRASAHPPIPLHIGAERYYRAAGHL